MHIPAHDFDKLFADAEAEATAAIQLGNPARCQSLKQYNVSSSDALSIDLREALEQLLLVRLTHAQAIVGNRTMENDLTFVVRRICV
jgi:hypothetical protein